jgi:plastocyanin
MRASRLLFAGLAALLACWPVPSGRAVEHCAAGARVTPVTDSPGWFKVETARGATSARWPAPVVEEARPNYVIRAADGTWDSDGVSGTVEDTLVVPVGATVRWSLVDGIHTLTSGAGADDPNAGLQFDYLLDEQHPAFDSTFDVADTVSFFCYFHEPQMRGVIFITGSAGVPGEPLPARLGFSRPPRPNPSRGAVGFNVTVPREERVRVEVIDMTGRRVALLHDGALEAGDHPFRWRGWSDAGEIAASGVYVIHLQSGDVTVTRRVSLLH